MPIIGSLTLHGLASNKKHNIDINESDLSKTLLDFLSEKKFPIASSCSGMGHCKKCVVNGGLLSCQITVEDCLQGINEITVSYL